tara:strand:+ start:116 stop:520 length:405 start_codon:yes stop_codon:yes gene_type:complete
MFSEIMTSDYLGKLKRLAMVSRRLIYVVCILTGYLTLTSKTQAETWECSVTEGWSAELKDVVFIREGISFKTNSKYYNIIYESDREVHLYRNEFGSVMTAITLFKETSEMLELTFYPPSNGRARHSSGGSCLVR